jgi:hemerythrin superfamily protein
MKITVLLRKDHETVMSLFAKFNKAQGRPNNGKKEAFEDIRRELTLHSQIEDEIFYSALENTTSTKVPDLLSQARTDHRLVETLLEELGSMNAGDSQFDTKMGELMAAVEGHVELEEEQIFEEARQQLSEVRLEELGLEMDIRRRILTQLAA